MLFIIIYIFPNEQNCTMCFTLHETFNQINKPALPLTFVLNWMYHVLKSQHFTTNDSTCICMQLYTCILGLKKQLFLYQLHDVGTILIIAVISGVCHHIPIYYRPLCWLQGLGVLSLYHSFWSSPHVKNESFKARVLLICAGAQILD